MNPENPENPAAPSNRQDERTSLERILAALRYALLPLAAVALVAVMIVVIPTLGDPSQAAEDRQVGTSAPSSTVAPSVAGPDPAPTATTTPTASSSPPPAATPAPATTQPTEAAAEDAPASSPDGVAPTRITVAAAGIDVAVLPLVPTADELASQSIVPPISDDGYWLTSYGAPGAGSTDTTYIAGHSWEGRDAPFDLFSTNTEPGDTIVLDTMAGPLTYVVDDVTTYDKNTLKDSDIWDITPHRLVIISCFTEDPWGKNVVVTASPAA